MNIQSILTEPPEKQRYPALFYSALFLIFLTLFLGIWHNYSTHATERYLPYRDFVVPSKLLLYLLAFKIIWHPLVTVTLRIVSLLSIAFGCFYIYFFDRESSKMTVSQFSIHSLDRTPLGLQVCMRMQCLVSISSLYYITESLSRVAKLSLNPSAPLPISSFRTVHYSTRSL
jgi:hypothetical protein